MLADFIIPGSCGKLPTDIGMPSGGSLTADQWLLLATVYGPIIIPQLWSLCLPEDTDDNILCHRVVIIEKLEAKNLQEATRKAVNKKALEEAKKLSKEALETEKARIAQENLAISEAKKQEKLQQQAAKQAEKVRLTAARKAKNAEMKLSKKRKSTSQTVEDLPEGQVRAPPPPPGAEIPTQPETAHPDDNDDLSNTDEKFSLHPDDPINFLKLCSALRILIRRKLSDHDINQADSLLHEYNIELIKLYGSNAIKPNHHFFTHVGECARNFGLLHDFWTFLFERLNKVLKSFKTNNHANGELETTFFKEFQRTCELGRLTYTLRTYPPESVPSQAAQVMLKASKEERGTVAGLATLSEELDDVSADAGLSYTLSPHHQVKTLSSDTYRALARTLCFRYPQTPAHCRYEHAVVPHSVPLNPQATFFDYVIVDGKWFYASRSVGTNKASLVHTVTPGPTIMHAYGELLEIFQVDQSFSDGARTLWFARMRWFKAFEGVYDGIWKDFASVNVRLWELGEFRGQESQLPELIELDWLHSLLGMAVVSIGKD
ncbi:hypothetical protein BDN67DRAFT_1016592 [Paxillus ammoniavirescens]|nr:hypothetical protein BDN67DRAFT_1016592 [Paxillus ammoniavirescens]